MKIIIDNNFFDYYVKSNDEEREKIREFFTQRKGILCPHLELLAEMLGLYKTKRAYLLLEYARMILLFMGDQIYNSWNRIIMSELGFLEDEGVFLGLDTMPNIIQVLDTLAQGKILENMGDLIRFVSKEKNSFLKSAIQIQSDHFKRLKKEGVETPKWSFEEFYQKKFSVNHRKELIKNVFERLGQQLDDFRISEIEANAKDYPYFFTYCRVVACMLYRQIVLGRAIKTGDGYDQYYLVYLKGADLLVSADRAMIETANMVFPSSKRALSCLQFKELIRPCV